MLTNRRWMGLAGIVLLVLTGLLGWRAVRIPVRYSLDSLFLAQDANLDTYKAFVERFGSDDRIMVVAYATDDVLAPKGLRALHEASQAIEALPGVAEQLNLVEVLHTIDQLKHGALFTGFSREITDLEGLLGRAAGLRTGVLGDSCFVGPFVSADATTAMIHIELTGPARAAGALRTRTLAGIDAALARTVATHGGQFWRAGIPLIEEAYARQIERDQRIFLPTGVVLFAILLTFYFRRVVGVLGPLLVVGMAVAWTLGGLELAGGALDIVTSALPVLLLVIGITDAIHVMAHYYQRRAAGAGQAEARRETFREMRMACFVTSFTTGIGFLSLKLVNVRVLQNFGVYAAFGLITAYLLTMAGLWILLVLNERYEQAPPMMPETLAEAHLNGFGERTARHSRALPWLGLTVGMSVLLGFGWASTHVRVESDWFQDFPDGHALPQATREIERRVTGVFSLEIVLERAEGRWSDPAQLTRVRAASRKIEALEGVTDAISLADLIAEANYWFAGKRVIPANPKGIEQLLATLRKRGGAKLLKWMVSEDLRLLRINLRLREVGTAGFATMYPRIHAQLEQSELLSIASVAYTGKSWLAGRAMDQVVENMLYSLGAALIVISVTMMVLFRSIRIGLISILPNVMPLVVTLGAMALIGIRLNFSTLFVFSIALGIAVDDTIHVLSRYGHELRRGAAGAIARTYRTVGVVITITTLFLILGVSVLYLSEFKFLHHFALLMQITLVSALVGDLVLLPAMMALSLGRCGGTAAPPAASQE